MVAIMTNKSRFRCTIQMFEKTKLFRFIKPRFLMEKKSQEGNKGEQNSVCLTDIVTEYYQFTLRQSLPSSSFSSSWGFLPKRPEISSFSLSFSYLKL